VRKRIRRERRWIEPLLMIYVAYGILLPVLAVIIVTASAGYLLFTLFFR
jgi:hypothetical protein